MGFLVLALIVFNIFTVYKFLFNSIFADHDDFSDSVRYSFTPNIISLFKGEYWKDLISEFKLGFFIMICILVTGIEYLIINGIIQWIIGLVK